MKLLESPYLSARGWRRLPLHGVSQDRASLTAALRRRAPVTVQVLRQRLGRPDAHERRLLGASASRRVMLREILLICGGVAVVYGRTAIPPRALRGAWRKLGSLGSRALGDFIFADPSITRSGFVLKHLAPAHALVRRIQRLQCLGQHAQLGKAERVRGARRCLLRRQAQAIVLTEIFLAHFPPRLPCSDRNPSSDDQIIILETALQR